MRQIYTFGHIASLQNRNAILARRLYLRWLVRLAVGWANMFNAKCVTDTMLFKKAYDDRSINFKYWLLRLDPGNSCQQVLSTRLPHRSQSIVLKQIWHPSQLTGWRYEDLETVGD
jgi:hypothetical protein